MNQHGSTKQLLTDQQLKFLDAGTGQRGNGDGVGEPLLDDEVADRLLLLRRRGVNLGQHLVWCSSLLEGVGFVLLALKHLSTRGLEFSAGLKKGVGGVKQNQR